MDSKTETKTLCKSYGLIFKDCGEGHIQIIGKGSLVNYWPGSKSRTAHVAGMQSIKNCTPYDAIKLALVKKGGPADTLKPKKKRVKNNAPQKRNFIPKITNPCGLKNFYSGDLPPWDESLGDAFQFESTADLYRYRAKLYQDRADMLKFTADNINP